MLVLTRKAGQAILIGDDVEITVVEVRGDQVRLGIRAPRNVAILRREIVEDIHQENREAAAVDANILIDLSELSDLAPDEETTSEKGEKSS